jgi:hypothetical protein
MEVTNIISKMARIVDRLVELEDLQATRGHNSVRLEEQLDLHNELIKLSLKSIEGIRDARMV